MTPTEDALLWPLAMIIMIVAAPAGWLALTILHADHHITAGFPAGCLLGAVAAGILWAREL
jgi:hypothetical protein